MSYRYFDHDADIGIVGIGRSFPEAFAEAARAMFGVMADLERVRPLQTVAVRCQAASLNDLFVEWLNTLLAESESRHLCFCEFVVHTLEETALRGEVRGEPWDPARHRLKGEVKAATYCMVETAREGDEYRCQCVIDI